MLVQGVNTRSKNPSSHTLRQLFSTRLSSGAVSGSGIKVILATTSVQVHGFVEPEPQSHMNYGLDSSS
jgi:hypothetical protein